MSMEKLMSKEFHKPFVKSLVIIAFFTVFFIISSRYIVNYYSKMIFKPQKTTEYSSQESQETSFHAF